MIVFIQRKDSPETDLGFVKLVVMTNVFFHYNQHEIET